MNQLIINAVPNDFSWVVTVTKVLPESVKQEYRDEMCAIVKELQARFLRHRVRVDLAWYAVTKDEFLRLTVYAYDNELDVYALASLLQYLKWH